MIGYCIVAFLIFSSTFWVKIYFASLTFLSWKLLSFILIKITRYFNGTIQKSRPFHTNIFFSLSYKWETSKPVWSWSCLVHWVKLSLSECSDHSTRIHGTYPRKLTSIYCYIVSLNVPTLTHIFNLRTKLLSGLNKMSKSYSTKVYI